MAVPIIKGFRVYASVKGKQGMQAISRIYHARDAAYEFSLLARKQYPDAEVRQVVGFE